MAQRTDYTRVLAAVRTLNRMEFVGETLRAALEALVAAPAWLSGLVATEWAERYGPRVDDYRFPRAKRSVNSGQSRSGGTEFVLLEAAYASTAPDWLRKIEAVQVLRNAWIQQYHRDEKGVRWRRERTSRQFITDCARPPTPMPATGSSADGAGPATRCI